MREVGREIEVRPREQCPWCHRLGSAEVDPRMMGEPVVDLRKDKVPSKFGRYLEVAETPRLRRALPSNGVKQLEVHRCIQYRIGIKA